MVLPIHLHPRVHNMVEHVARRHKADPADVKQLCFQIALAWLFWFPRNCSANSFFDFNCQLPCQGVSSTCTLADWVNFFCSFLDWAPCLALSWPLPEVLSGLRQQRSGIRAAVGWWQASWIGSGMVSTIFKLEAGFQEWYLGLFD